MTRSVADCICTGKYPLLFFLAENIRGLIANGSRYFPYEWSFEPTRNIKWRDRNTLHPRIWRVDNSSHFLACGPTFWILSPEYMTFSSLAELRARCAQTFLPEARVFLPRRGRLRSDRRGIGWPRCGGWLWQVTDHKDGVSTSPDSRLSSEQGTYL